MVVKRAQELNSDLGFGNLIYRKLPEWERLEPRWQEIFPNVNITISKSRYSRADGLCTTKVGERKCLLFGSA